MAHWLTYTVPGRGHLFPIVPTLLELRRRGHRVTVYAAPEDLAILREHGLDAYEVDPALEPIGFTGHEESNPLKAARSENATFIAKARIQAPDLERAIARHRPDALLIDTLAYGAMAAAEASSLPWSTYVHLPLPVRSPGLPPFGLGLKPMAGPLGRLRDGLAYRMGLRGLERQGRGPINQIRAARGLWPIRDTNDLYLHTPQMVLWLSAEPFEYHRSNLPDTVHQVGPGIWDPATDAPEWLDALPDPLVLVTCSSMEQADAALARTALEALPGEVGSLVVTTAGFDPVDLPSALNARVERFVPHGPVLERAAAVICHAGMGITQKALAHGVPVCAVPFGRDQFEVARRVELADAGVRLPGKQLTPERLRSALRATLSKRPGAQRIATAFREAGGAPAAADALEALAGAPNVAHIGA